MTPYQHHGRGTFVIDLRFDGVGRIKRASGTKNKRLWNDLKAMCRALYRGGRRDVLVAIRDGNLSFLEVWEHYRLGDWEKIPTAETMTRLDLAVGQWLERIRCGEDHLKSLHRSWGALLELAPKDATLRAVPEIVKAYRLEMEGEHHRTFNLARSAAQSFVRDLLGRDHRLWWAIHGTPTLSRQSLRRHHPCGVDEARELALRLGTKAGPMWWTLCTTGMGRKEYWGDWQVLGNRIAIHGTKREGRDRVVPMIAIPVRPMLTYWGFRQALRRLNVPQTLYDGRRTYSHLLETAQIPRTRRKLYMGQGKRDVLDLYEDHDVTTYLDGDAAKLRALLGAPAMWVVK